MKTLDQFLSEAEDETTDLETAKKTLIMFVSSNMARFLSKSDRQDNTPLLMLIAALQLINIASDTQSLTVARRLATAALGKSSKKS